MKDKRTEKLIESLISEEFTKPQLAKIKDSMKEVKQASRILKSNMDKIIKVIVNYPPDNDHDSMPNQAELQNLVYGLEDNFDEISHGLKGFVEDVEYLLKALK
jgi:hypothetical protein